jgi:plastocyanin
MMRNRLEILALTLVLAVFTAGTPTRAQETVPEEPESAAKIDFQVIVDPDGDRVKYEGTTSQAEIGDLVRFSVEDSEATSYK